MMNKQKDDMYKALKKERERVDVMNQSFMSLQRSLGNTQAPSKPAGGQWKPKKCGVCKGNHADRISEKDCPTSVNKLNGTYGKQVSLGPCQFKIGRDVLCLGEGHSTSEHYELYMKLKKEGKLAHQSAEAQKGAKGKKGDGKYWKGKGGKGKGKGGKKGGKGKGGKKGGKGKGGKKGGKGKGGERVYQAEEYPDDYGWGEDWNEDWWWHAGWDDDWKWDPNEEAEDAKVCEELPEEEVQWQDAEMVYFDDGQAAEPMYLCSPCSDSEPDTDFDEEELKCAHS